MTEPVVLQHYARHLGQPERTFVNDLYPFKVCRFLDQPYAGCMAYATIGMSEHILKRNSGLDGSQEIIILADNRFGVRGIENLLFVVGGDVLKRETALRKGEILGPAGPLIVDATVEALLCNSPPFFPESFDQIDRPRPIVIVGLIPLTQEEAKFAKVRGLEVFQDALIEEQPNIADFERVSMRACHSAA